MQRVVDFYDSHPISERQILEKLDLDGIDTADLSQDVLQNYDQDHFGGVEANDALARAAGIDENSLVLDVCCGLGGPARYLAQNYGCRVTGIDLTASRVSGAERLSALVGLSERVSFRTANALDNSFADESFDVVVSQEAWAHVPDKPRLIAECVRVVKRGGRLAFTDIVARPETSDAVRRRLEREMAFNEPETFEGYQMLLSAAGCTVVAAVDLSQAWARILLDRLAMYRSLKGQTVERFGAEHFEKWDDTYSFFVGLYQSGELGGGRFIARRTS